MRCGPPAAAQYSRKGATKSVSAARKAWAGYHRIFSTIKTTALLLLAGALTISRPARAQTGCPDPQATNCNPAARLNDGSCQYAPATAALPTKALLNAAVPETSGLQLAAGALWTFNDGGNPPVLFRVDSATSRAAQQVRVLNYPNTG